MVKITKLSSHYGMTFDIVTLFPEMFSALESGITGRALKQKIIELQFWNPRDFTNDTQKRVVKRRNAT